MFTDDDRRTMYNALEASLGPRPAAIVMGHLPPTGWADLATRHDMESQGLALRAEIAELRAEVKGEITELRAELKGEIAELRAEVRSMLPRLVAANIASMIGVAGLVLAATSIAA